MYFVGAGPGAADLLTLRAAQLLSTVNVVLYAGSLVPHAVLSHCRPAAELIDTASLDLEQQCQLYVRAASADHDVVRLHSGDPSIYGAMAEQMRCLEAMGIAYEVVPGVSSFSAAAAALSAELTKPGVSQTIILTRVSGRASPVPQSESLETLAAHKSTMCIFLSGPHLVRIVQELQKHYPADTPIALVRRVSWDDEHRLVSTLEKVLEETAASEWQLTTMLIVGAVLDKTKGQPSQLYCPSYDHRFRRARRS